MRVIATALTMCLLAAAHADAQQAPLEPPPTEAPRIEAPASEPGRAVQIGVAVGPGLDLIVPTSGSASVTWAPRFSLRFAADGGWSPTVGFGWFDTGIDGVEFGRDERMGDLQLRPIMLGARYTWLRGEYSVDVAATAGPSFSDFDINGDVARRIFGAGQVRAEASTSLATKVQGGIWYDYTDKVSFRGTVAYFRCAPEITVTSGGQARRFTQPAHALQLGASVVYRIF